MRMMTIARVAAVLAAIVAATAISPRVCEAQLTFTLADSSTWPSAAEWQDVYNKMTYNCNLYNAFATFGPYNIYVYYSSGIPTEQASYGGYGGSIGVGQQYPQYWNLQHEMSHYLGTGTYWQWPNLMYNGVWHGAFANALEQQFDGVGATLNGDTQHFWPYGLNYATEDSHIAEERHMALDYAILQDMGLEPSTPASSATTVSLLASDAVGTSGFNYMDNWSDTHFAHTGAAYFTGNYAIRTPADGGSYTFAGNSLTLNNSGDATQGLFYKGTGTAGVITINNLIFNGGSTHHFSTTSDLFQLAGQATLAAGGGTINSEQGNTNVLAAISGSGNLTIGVTNGNVVSLLAVNTFTGTTTVTAGTLALGAGGSAGTIRGPLVINPGSLVNLTAADSLGFGSGTSVPNVFINGGVLNSSIAGNNSYITNYVLTGGSMTSTGGGPIHFSTGYGITTNAGSATSVISAPLKIRDQNNLTFNVAAGTTPSGVDLLISGAIGNDPYNGGALNAITKAGAGAMTLSGASTYSGGTSLNAGTLNINSVSAIGSGALTIAGSTTINNTSGLPITLATNNTQTWSGDFTFGGSSALNMGTGAVTMMGNRTITTNGAGALTVGPIGQSGGSWQLIKTGAGKLIFGGSNSYSGPTTISAGTLQIGAGGASGSLAPASSITDNATLAFNRSNTITQGIDLSGAISGTGSVVQLGAGTLNMAGSNTYSGGTQILAGTLLLSGSLNASGAVTLGNATFTYSPTAAATQSLPGLTLSGGAATISNTTPGSTLALGAITRNLNATVDFAVSSGSVTTTNTNVNGILGPWAFAGTGSYTTYAAVTGGNVSPYAGAIVESDSTSAWGGIPSGDNHTVNYEITANGAFAVTGVQRNVNTIQYAGIGGTQTSNNTGVLLVTNGILNSGTGPLVIGGGANQLNVQIGTNREIVVAAMTGGVAINNVISDSASGSSSLTKTGPATLTLAGANTYSGGTTIDAGAISISADSNLGASAGTVTLNGGMLTTTAGVTNTHPFLIGPNGGTINVASPSGSQYYFHTANTLLGSGPLTLGGTGTLTAYVGNLRVDAANSYSGNLTVQGGGIFEYGAASAVSSSATFTIGNQGEVAVQTGITLPNSITISGGTNSVLSFENGTGGVFSGPIILTAGATVGLRDWYTNSNVRQGTITGQITGSGGLSINSGSGTGGALALGNSTNNYTGGTTVTNATLLIGSPSIGGLGTTIAGEAGALGSGSLTINGGGIAQLGYRSQNISPTAPQTVPNNISLNGGAIFGNDNYQHLSGALNVAAAGGTLGSTYEGASGNWNKGLFVDGVVSGGGNLTVVQAGAYELNGWGNEQGNGYNVGITMFSNPANSYSGTVTVNPYNAGGGNYLAVNNSTTLQYATINLTGNNTGTTPLYGTSTLLFQTGLGAATLGALIGSGNVALTGMNEQTAVSGGDAIALAIGNNGANTTYSGIMSGAGSLTKIGTGTTVLANANTYAGATNLNAGTLRLGVNQALPSTTVATISGGILDLNGHSNSISQLIATNGNMSQANGSLTITTGADGAIQLGGAVGSTGSYTMSGGSLTVTSGPADVGWYGSGTFNQTGGLVTTNNFLILGRQTGSTGVYNISGGTVTNTGNLLAVGQQGSGTLTVSGSGAVVAGGAGLSVGGLFGGGGNGTLNLNAGGRIQTPVVTTGGGVSTFNFNGGTLQAAAGASSNFFSGVTSVVSGSGGATIDTNGNNIYFPSPLSGPGGLTKSGAGTMVVPSTDTYAGPTVVSGGVLQLGSIMKPQLDYTFSSGSAVNTGNNAGTAITRLVASPLISATGGPNGLGVLTLNGSNFLDIKASSLPNLGGNANYTIAMWINTTEAGASVLYKGTTGAWSSRDENFYLTSGTPNSNSGGSGSTVGGVQWAGGFIGGNTAVNTGAWQFISIVRSGGSATVYVNGVADGTTAGSAGVGMGNPEQGTQEIDLGYNSGVSHDGALMFNGSISGAYVYSSALTQPQILALMNAGPTGAGALPSTTALSISNSGAAFDLNGLPQTVASLSGAAGANVYVGGGTLTVAGSGSTTFAGNISDSGGASAGVGGRLSMNGTGKLTLSGTDTYSGGTFVSNGTLVVTSPAGLAASSNLTIGSTSFFSADVVVPQAESATAVPEPSAAALLALAAAAAGCGFWRRGRGV